jgi:tryptophanyl-tRNA synthetase
VDQKLHREKGGNCDVDVAFQCLRFFLTDDEPHRAPCHKTQDKTQEKGQEKSTDTQLEQIGADYRAGKLLAGQMKQILVDTLQPIIAQHQSARALVTDTILDAFMQPHPIST